MSVGFESITCRELVELVSDYIDGALSPYDQERFEAHLQLCEPCVTYIEQMRRTIEATGHVTQESLPPPAREAMLETFRTWKRERAV